MCEASTVCVLFVGLSALVTSHKLASKALFGQATSLLAVVLFRLCLESRLVSSASHKTLCIDTSFFKQTHVELSVNGLRLIKRALATAPHTVETGFLALKSHSCHFAIVNLAQKLEAIDRHQPSDKTMNTPERKSPSAQSSPQSAPSRNAAQSRISHRSITCGSGIPSASSKKPQRRQLSSLRRSSTAPNFRTIRDRRLPPGGDDDDSQGGRLSNMAKYFDSKNGGREIEYSALSRDSSFTSTPKLMRHHWHSRGRKERLSVVLSSHRRSFSARASKSRAACDYSERCSRVSELSFGSDSSDGIVFVCNVLCLRHFWVDAWRNIKDVAS